jgi:hypothetical protein
MRWFDEFTGKHEVLNICVLQNVVIIAVSLRAAVAKFGGLRANAYTE